MWIAVRSLLKARGFTVTVVATLAIGITLASTVLAVVNGYLMQSLPYPCGDRLYSIRFEPGQRQPEGLERLDWQSLSSVIDHPIAWDLDMFYVTSGDRPEQAPGAWITPGFLEGLGIRAEIGRVFNSDEFRAGSPQVAMISHSLWRDRFGNDPAILGKQFKAYVSDRPEEAETFSIVGVLPVNFWHVNPYTQVFAPLRTATYPYMVRLRPGIPALDAERRISDLIGKGIQLRSVHEEYTRAIRPILTTVSAAAGIVLLIACANVAFLMLIRSNRQQKDVAIRFALGAGRARMVRMVFIESFILCGAATVIGLTLSALVIEAIGPVIQQQLGRPVPGGLSALSVGLPVVAMAAVLSAGIALLLSVAPLIASRRHGLATMMRRGRQSGAEGVGGRRARSVLIVIEVAGSLALLVGCGLMIRTLLHELGTDMGVVPDRVFTTGLALRERSYPDETSRQAFYAKLLEGIRQVGGVESAGLANPPIFSPHQLRQVEGTMTNVITVSGDYFATLGLPLKEGRSFTNFDRQGAEAVAVISQTLARRLWSTTSAVGHQIRIVNGDAPPITRTIIGVVGDVRQVPTDEDLADLYVPLLQTPGRFASIHVRSSLTAASLTSALQQLIKTIDPEVALNPIRDVRSMADDQLIRPRFLTSLLSTFALLAVILALVGIYGVIAYSVKQREHEIAVRMAVGASAWSVTHMFLREGTIVIAVGLVGGVFGARAIGEMLQSQLYGIQPFDTWTIVAMSFVIALCGTIATWWPARRAASTDPILALRAE